jgi:hypothetical protein
MEVLEMADQKRDRNQAPPAKQQRSEPEPPRPEPEKVRGEPTPDQSKTPGPKRKPGQLPLPD